MPKTRDFLELVRIPGVFTAQADVLAGFLIAGAAVQKIPAFLLLVMASSSFYSAGMALNDAFDAPIDARQRPGRPIPSGRIALNTAFYTGFGLLLLGLLLSRLAGFSSFVVGVVLAAAIITYDGGVKQVQWAGPVNMGACRYLNLLLGLSLAPITAGSLLIPLLTGIYIFGVTALSRHETEGNDMRGILVCGMAIAVIPLLYWLLWLFDVLPVDAGLVLCTVLFLVLSGLLLRLAKQPSPANTQQTIKWLLMALVILDGIIVSGACSLPWGAFVWAMLIPVVIVSRKFYVT
ncbi:MAG: UbiA family prenyltransferase [Desulfosarcina sp.]|nr:UbiA family prenyltransferase [Desulfosarcina sp.]MBC2741610.1 UbiA family prenyltransferase [Desulfosarcina sp.]MBC2764524.1 UbiA family prenyltransferase [Desulfosarcina sp.]